MSDEALVEEGAVFLVASVVLVSSGWSAACPLFSTADSAEKLVLKEAPSHRISMSEEPMMKRRMLFMLDKSRRIVAGISVKYRQVRFDT